MILLCAAKGIPDTMTLWEKKEEMDGGDSPVKFGGCLSRCLLVDTRRESMNPPPFM